MKESDESVILKLQTAIAISQNNIKTSKKNEATRRLLNKTIKDSVESIETLTDMKHIFEILLKDTEDFQAEKQNSTISSIYSAIYSAKAIVEEAGEIIPQIKAGEFWLETSKGQRISRVEGDGVKALASLFMRKTVLKNSEYLDYMILDESISAVSNNNSAEFSKYLPAISRDMLIILIEQKPTVFENAGDIVEYHVRREGEFSVVTREGGN